MTDTPIPSIETETPPEIIEVREAKVKLASIQTKASLLLSMPLAMLISWAFSHTSHVITTIVICIFVSSRITDSLFQFFRRPLKKKDSVESLLLKHLTAKSPYALSMWAEIDSIHFSARKELERRKSNLLQRPAAVDNDHLAGDEARVNEE